MAYHDPGPQIAANERGGRIATGAALLSAFALAAVIAGSIWDSLLLSLSLLLFAAPGIPLARRWFSGAPAILAGSLLGYFLGSILASLLVRWEALSLEAALAASAALFFLVRAVARRIAPRPSRGPAPGEVAWLAATLALSVLLIALPFARVGEEVGDGIAYRAYFSADLMTHLSVAAELQKGDYPPANPFFAGDRLGYYWLFFTFPAAAGLWISNQEALLLVYIASGMVFAGLLFTAASELGLRPPRAFLAAAAVLTAVSYEGILVLGRMLLEGEPFRDTNVDAFGRWVLGLVSLDGLHRSLLYTPQHLFSYSALSILLVLVFRGEPRDRAGALLSGVLLAAMAGTSIVTAMLAGPWLLLVVLARAGSLRKAAELSVAIGTPALLCLLWYFELGFFAEAGGALRARLPGLAEIPSILLLEAGALVLLVLARRSFELRDRELAGLSVLALGAVLFLDLEGYEGIWMAWRAGSVLLLTLGLLAAPALGGALGPRHALILVPALATTGLDLYNAQDVSNRSVSAGEFRWTTVVSFDEWEALRWIRESTPPEAVVQWDVRARELGEWAFVPALAERRMAVGSPIFLLDLRKYRVRERREVRPIFSWATAAEAHRLASGLGIDYLFVGHREMRIRGEALRKLFESPEAFRPVFANDGVTVLKVLP